MARDINTRLNQLHIRRHGTDRLERLVEDERRVVLAKSFDGEDWQRRASSKPFTRYTLGAMQEVGPDYTRVSMETAERVGNQLKTGLNLVRIPAEFQLQGSVPLNVHIRGVSDVDILSIDTSFLLYHKTGPRAQESPHFPLPGYRSRACSGL